jgi:hypothetical protein
VSAWAIAVKEKFSPVRESRKLRANVCDVEVCEGRDSLWVIVSRDGFGGFALRTAYSPAGPIDVKLGKHGEGLEFLASNAIGRFRVTVTVSDSERSLIRARVALTPSTDVIIPFWPRDLYPLDNEGSPLDTHGAIQASQRGLCSGLVYFTMDRPAFGAGLYMQNLTALNDYFQLTGTKPAGAVGGRWPELGYAMPVSVEKPLPAGREVVISDAIVAWDSDVPHDEQALGQTFLDLLAGIYPNLDRPDSLYHDWPARAEQTLRDLEHAPDVTVKQYGNVYLHPYVAAEYPDSMVQLTVLTPMLELAQWGRRDIEFAAKLRAGVKHFYNDEAGTIVRYLPTVGKDKNPHEVESWYLYHPLTNLGRLASEGDTGARELFLGSMDYAITVARHFKYNWPIKFDLLTLDLIDGHRKDGQPGQSDAGGLYAYIMLQAWDLTHEKRYIDEAMRAIEAVHKRGFEMEYQSNLSAWGAVASLRLWLITRNDYFRDQSYVFLANFFRYTLMWESKIGVAAHYPKFLGVASLSDANYMALYECYESYQAFDEYLHWGGDNIREAVQILLTEYCKYTLTRAWYYYPSELPEEIIAKEPRNGHIDRNLSIPVEDLYAEDRPAGAVGQEIYGCGAAFTFTTRAYHSAQAPFMLYCEYPIHEVEAIDTNRLSFRIRGVPGYHCRARLIPRDAGSMPECRIIRGDSVDPIKISPTPEGHGEFDASAGTRMEIYWESDSGR